MAGLGSRAGWPVGRMGIGAEGARKVAACCSAFALPQPLHGCLCTANRFSARFQPHCTYSFGVTSSCEFNHKRGGKKLGGCQKPLVREAAPDCRVVRSAIPGHSPATAPAAARRPRLPAWLRRCGRPPPLPAAPRRQRAEGTFLGRCRRSLRRRRQRRLGRRAAGCGALRGSGRGVAGRAAWTGRGPSPRLLRRAPRRVRLGEMRCAGLARSMTRKKWGRHARDDARQAPHASGGGHKGGFRWWWCGWSRYREGKCGAPHVRGSASPPREGKWYREGKCGACVWRRDE